MSLSLDPSVSGAIGSSRGRNAPSSQGRRLTRARGTTGTVTASHLPSAARSNFTSSRTVRKWKRVRRVPVGTTFSVFMWVPVDQLTEEEQQLHADAIQGGASDAHTTIANEKGATMGAEPMEMSIDESTPPEPLTEDGAASTSIPLLATAMYDDANVAPAVEQIPSEPSITSNEPPTQESVEESTTAPISHESVVLPPTAVAEVPTVTIDPTIALE